jgi:hypothetical protein
MKHIVFILAFFGGYYAVRMAPEVVDTEEFTVSFPARAFEEQQFHSVGASTAVTNLYTGGYFGQEFMVGFIEFQNTPNPNGLLDGYIRGFGSGLVKKMGRGKFKGAEDIKLVIGPGLAIPGKEAVWDIGSRKARVRFYIHNTDLWMVGVLASEEKAYGPKVADFFKSFKAHPVVDRVPASE